MRYDGIRAHVKKQHPDVELPRRFSRNLKEERKTKNIIQDQTPSVVNQRALLMVSQAGSPIDQKGECCSCKYYNFVSFLINNGINIEKLKENISLLKI